MKEEMQLHPPGQSQEEEEEGWRHYHLFVVTLSDHSGPGTSPISCNYVARGQARGSPKNNPHATALMYTFNLDEWVGEQALI